MTNVTIALWVNVRADQTWQRVFDFGSSTNVYMFLTPHAGGTSIARFAITTSGNANEQHLDATSVLPVGTWTHVAIVLGAGGGTLYLNGAAVATNAALMLRPADLGAAANNWNRPFTVHGRSGFQWPDRRAADLRERADGRPDHDDLQRPVIDRNGARGCHSHLPASPRL